LFDPLQFLSPFTIRAKILLQKNWTAGVGWDEQLPENLRVEWNVWINELKDLSHFEIPRPLRGYSDHPPTSRLIAAKSRVAPLKAVTIPRLELMGAVLASRLSSNISGTLNVNGATYWSDSTNVLYWIHNQSRIFKPFVANRVAEIQRNSNSDEWRHIPGEINPADLPTRGLSTTELCHNKSWMEGPEFFTDERMSWPERLPNNPSANTAVKDEEKKVQTHATSETEDVDRKNRLDPKRYSSWTRLVRVTAWIKRFIKNCKTVPVAKYVMCFAKL
jgi:hypothetical protein